MPTAVLEKQATKEKTEPKYCYRAPIAIYENGDSYVVIAELPGADERAIQLRLDKGVLDIEAPLKLDLPPGTRARYSELCLGDYRRSVDVGNQVEADRIEASFKNGLLKVTMPKSISSKARKIPIKVAP